MSIAGFSFCIGVLLVTLAQVWHLELPNHLVQYQFLRQWKQMTQSFKLQYCLQHWNFLHQQYWNVFFLSVLNAAPFKIYFLNLNISHSFLLQTVVPFKLALWLWYFMVWFVYKYWRFIIRMILFLPLQPP